MNDEVDRFTPAGEKIISHELNQVIWCNHMDMLALVTKDNILEVILPNPQESSSFEYRCIESVIKTKRSSNLKRITKSLIALSALMVDNFVIFLPLNYSFSKIICVFP